MDIKQKKILAMVSGLGFTVLVILGWWYYFSLPREFAVVDAGILYRSGQGRANQIQNVIRRFKIKTIVCLREVEPNETPRWLENEEQVARENGVDFLHWPTSSHKIPRETAQYQFLRLVQDPANQPILIHCAQGKHRTGFFISLYRMVVNDWSFGRTIKEMDSFGYGLETHPELMDGLRKLDPEKMRQTCHITPHPEKVARDRLDLLMTISLWTLFGFTGQFFFFSRFLIQWIASERLGRTHVPVAFWYLSLLGGSILTVYAIGRSDIVIILGQGLGCFIYIRNLMIIHRNRTATQEAIGDGG
jgi:lipid-A-disaccharide synthase-like uncharacterized protein/protein tyrosine phosphatase (PTP) superfamily phosphohydrolase (DUF442 family)